MRTYPEAFDRKTVMRISRLIKALEQLNDPRTGYKRYTYEIQECLRSGLLMAALSVSTALLELFIRDLVVAHRITRQFAGDMGFRGQIERETESDRQMGFAKMLDELQIPPLVLEPHDVQHLREFYERTRIPLAHGLVRRLTSSAESEGDDLSDLFAALARSTGLEYRIEDGAIIAVEFVVRIMVKYRPWLLRRLSVEQV